MSIQINSETLPSTQNFDDFKFTKHADESFVSKSQVIHKDISRDEICKSNSRSFLEEDYSVPNTYKTGPEDPSRWNQTRRFGHSSKYSYENIIKDISQNQDQTDSGERKERVMKKLANMQTLLDKIQPPHNVEQKIDSVKSKASMLTSNFEASVKVGRNIHEKYQCIKQLSTGQEFTKLGYKSTKVVKRFVFYSENMEAICWRDPKAKIPKTKQMIYLSDITKINDNFKSSRAFKKYANRKIEEELFFSIETNDRTFDLLATNVQIKKLWVKTLNLLVLMGKSKRKDGAPAGSHEDVLSEEKSFEVVAKQFTDNFGNLHTEIEDIKKLCYSNEKKLKRNFLELAEEAITRETEQTHILEKAVKVLDSELREVKSVNETLKTQNLSTIKHLEASNLKGKQLLAQLRSYNEEKKHIVDFIRQFQKKLLNCVEFLSMLDFEVHEKDGEQFVSTNSIAEGTVLNEDFSNLDIFMNQMQLQFDVIMFRSGQMQKRFSDLQEQLKENAELQEATQKEKNSCENKYNEIYALYNETVLEKEKLMSELSSFNGQLTHNIKENIKLKKEICELEDQLNEVKSTSLAKDNELQEMIDYAKRLQTDMEVKFDELRKDSEKSEINKLGTLEERYNMQIRRYENKILENEKVINEFSELMKNYETQMHEYVQEIEEKKAYIDDLTASRDKLNQMIMEMEENMKRNKEMKTPSRRSTADMSTQGRAGSTLASLEDQMPDEVNLLSTQRNLKVVMDERESVQRQLLCEMEANLVRHTEEIDRLREENEHYKMKATKVKQNEEELKQKITRYQSKMKNIMYEGAKARKNFKQLELYMSHWLNLIYLENMMLFIDEIDPLSLKTFSQETNHDILFRGIDRLKDAFLDMPVDIDFLNKMIQNVEDSIPNITFDSKLTDLAQAYLEKAKTKTCKSHRRSSELSTTMGSHQGQYKSISLGLTSPFISLENGTKDISKRKICSLKMPKESEDDREPFKQLFSPVMRRVDDSTNKRTRQKMSLKLGNQGVNDYDKENGENLFSIVNI